MSKVIDITNKLTFDENPKVKVKGVEIELNANAVDLFKVLAIVQSGDTSPEAISTLCEVLFPSKKEYEKVRELDLKSDDFTTFLFVCARIAFGNEDEDTEGEAQTPATT